jgi:hypothetical protein
MVGKIKGINIFNFKITNSEFIKPRETRGEEVRVNKRNLDLFRKS